MNNRDRREDSDKFVTLAYFANAAEAGMVQELLLNNQINAILQGANFGGLEPLPMIGGFSEIQLLVPEAELDRARQLYQAFFESEVSILKENEEVDDE